MIGDFNQNGSNIMLLNVMHTKYGIGVICVDLGKKSKMFLDFPLSSSRLASTSPVSLSGLSVNSHIKPWPVNVWSPLEP